MSSTGQGVIDKDHLGPLLLQVSKITGTCLISFVWGFFFGLNLSLSLSGVGWLPVCGEPRRKHCVCVRQRDSVSAIQAGGADQHQCL